MAVVKKEKINGKKESVCLHVLSTISSHPFFFSCSPPPPCSVLRVVVDSHSCKNFQPSEFCSADAKRDVDADKGGSCSQEGETSDTDKNESHGIAITFFLSSCITPFTVYSRICSKLYLSVSSHIFVITFSTTSSSVPAYICNNIFRTVFVARTSL